MSRKHKRQKQRRSFPWILVALGGVLIIVAVVLFAMRSNGSGVGSNNSGGTPKIAVDPQKVDYGYVKFGNDKTFTIKVTNAGTGSLRFISQPYVEVLEGC